MRVIAGSAKSLKLKTLESMDTRPTQDRTKETLFNVLGPYLADCRFIDLFSGSGGIGIEALSRGAKSCIFVEQNPLAIACIQENLNFTKLADRAKVLRGDVLTVLRQIPDDQPYDVIFMDPPYNKELEKQALQIIIKTKMVDEYTILVVEASLQTDFSYLDDLGLRIYKKKEYKTNQHVFIEKKTADD